MVDRIIGWAVNRRTTVLFLLVLLSAIGAWAFRTLRVDAFPDLTDVQVQILVEAPGLSPVEVERLAVMPIELALNGMPRVLQVRSISKYGFGAITTVFEDGVDLYFARTLISERLQQVREQLPQGTEASLGPLAGAISEIYQYVLEGNGQSLMELRSIHDRIVRPQLRTIPGVVEVNSFGGLVRQAQVTISPERLRAYGLTLHDVVEALEASNSVAPGGYLQHGDEQYILRGLGQATNLDDLRNTAIRAGPGGVPIRISDVAQVDYGPELRQGAVTKDGKGEVVSGFVMMLRGENSREVVERVRERVEDITRGLPEGVRIIPYYDQTDLVNGTLRTVSKNLIEGGLLVIAVLLLFLGDIRAALVVAATIPFSLLFAFIGMRWLGLSANLMSLGAIDFGMIVDGAVVMVEHFSKKLRQAAGVTSDVRPRITEAAREVGRPIAFGVLIIMLVYLPIVTLQGLEARMFRPMALTVGMALFGSLLLSLIYVPAISTWVFRKGVPHSRYAERLEDWLDRRYQPILARTIHAPKRVLLFALLLLGAAGALVPFLGSEFLPELDEGSLLIQATRDPSVSLNRSIEMQRELERTVLQTPEVTTAVGRIGRPEIASDPMGLHQTDMFVMLRPKSDWRGGIGKEDLIEEMQERLEDRVPGMAIRFTQPMAMRLDELISGVRADLAVKVFGDDPEQNLRVAQQIAQRIARIEAATEVQVEATQGQAYLNVRMDRNAMARFGIPMGEVQEALETAVGGRPVSSIYEGNYPIDVIVQYPASLRTSPEAIGAITVPSPGGARVPLSQIAQIRLEAGPVQVSREGAQRLVIAQANVRDRDLGSFVDEVRTSLAPIELPPGVYLRFGGEFENQERAMRRLRVVVPAAILLIAFLLFTSLRSWRLAGLVLANLPFAAIGGIIALTLRGLHLSVSASIGFIALFGVAVLNGLVLLSTVQRLRASGLDAETAAVQGARDRLRPVLMTAAVASIGFIPVAFSHGMGAEVQRPLATVVIGGLISSTLLTLLVLPTAYVLIERLFGRSGKRNVA
ncbi:MAG: CusA/CzcA family heavy metal efflux RND transporter [Gemmatimonadota bacterium]